MGLKAKNMDSDSYQIAGPRSIIWIFLYFGVLTGQIYGMCSHVGPHVQDFGV